MGSSQHPSEREIEFTTLRDGVDEGPMTVARLRAASEGLRHLNEALLRIGEVETEALTPSAIESDLPGLPSAPAP